MYKRPSQQIYKKPYKKSYSNKSKKSYLRTFRDLEVYQISEQLSVDIILQIKSTVDKEIFPSINKLIEKSLDIPVIISKAYTFRYDAKPQSHKQIKQAMDDCNEIIVYMEQIRDIFKDKIESNLCDDVIKDYIIVRKKMLNLKKSWEKWDVQDNVNLGRRKEDKKK